MKKKKVISVKSIIFKHSVISILFLFFLIMFLFYNTTVTVLFNLYTAKQENELKMTAKYIEIVLENTAQYIEEMIKDIPSADPEELKKILNNNRIREKIIGMGIIKNGNYIRLETEQTENYLLQLVPINVKNFSDSLKPGFADSKNLFFTDLNSFTDTSANIFRNEISIIYPHINDSYVVVILNKDFIYDIVATFDIGTDAERKTFLYDSKNRCITNKEETIPKHGSTYNYTILNNFQVRVLKNHAEIDIILDSVKMSIILVLAIFSLFLFVQYMIVKKRISMPINRIKNLMTFIEGGRFDIKLHDNSYKEVEELSKKIDKTIEKIAYLSNEIYKKEVLTAQANVKILQSQINPHFLLNTLNTLKMMAIKQQHPEIIKTLKILRELLYYGVYDASKNVSIKEELDNIENFLAIMELRFNKSINFAINCHENLLNHQTIKLILQPIVENSLKHGLIDYESFQLKIDIKKERVAIVFTIADNGRGIKADKLDKIREELSKEAETDFSESMGLKSINTRIKLKYGKEYGIAIYSCTNEGTTVKLKIPDIPSL